jgi:hypothetical protein
MNPLYINPHLSPNVFRLEVSACRNLVMPMKGGPFIDHPRYESMVAIAIVKLFIGIWMSPSVSVVVDMY